MIRLISGVVASHVLDQLASPSATVIAPAALKVSLFLLELSRRDLSGWLLRTAYVIDAAVGGGDHGGHGVHALLLLLQGR